MRVGLDLIEIARIEKSLQNSHFVRKVYTDEEQAYFNKKAKRAESAAGFFCAKEAFVKAVGCGIGPVSLTDVEVSHDEMRRPFLVLHGMAQKLAEGARVDLSITHDKTSAVAVVILEEKK